MPLRTLALDLELGDEHTVASMRVLRTVPADEMGAELDEWATNKAEVLRRPITVSVAELRDQLGEAEFLCAGPRSAWKVRNAWSS